MSKRVVLSWSGGKDCAWALHILRTQGEYEVVALATTMNQEAGRVAMHGIRRELLEAQAASLALPLWMVDLPWPCSNTEYESRMRVLCERAVSAGVQCFAFGDLFLQDIRTYRETQLQGTGLEPVFPVWGIPTPGLARQMIDSGLTAKLTCVDTEKLDASFAGRDFDSQLMADLPHTVDPCGENGEFHTFVSGGPGFSHPINVALGVKVVRDHFVYADLLPATMGAGASM